jgi:hypothetical protein
VGSDGTTADYGRALSELSTIVDDMVIGKNGGQVIQPVEFWA